MSTAVQEVELEHTHITIPQVSLTKGLNMFGSDRMAAVKEEMQQLITGL